MMSRILIVVLAFFAISDVQVALARLGEENNHVHVPSRPTGHSKVRKAHHKRRHLDADDIFGEKFAKHVSEHVKVMGRDESSSIWERLKSIEVANKPMKDGPRKKKKNSSD